MGCACSKPDYGEAETTTQPVPRAAGKEVPTSDAERFYRAIDVVEETAEGYVKVAVDTRTQQQVEIRYLRRGDTIDKYIGVPKFLLH